MTFRSSGRRILSGLLLALVAGGAALHGARPSRPSKLPNIVLIVADDLGYGDLGCYGQTRIRTPHLDRLAAEGLRFTQAYAGNTVCAPSRCALMTGRHTGHARIRSNAQVPLEPDDITIAEVLRNAGYKSGAVGKWALGWEGTTGHPNAQGFTEFLGYLDQVHAHDYYPAFLWRNALPFFPPGNQNGRRTEYAPAWLLKGATNFVRLCEDRPFFLYFTPILPHANNERGTNGMEVPDLGEYAREDWPAPEKAKAAMITYLDDMVGQVIADLRKRRLDDTTLVLFTSDNGPHQESGVQPQFFQSSGPLRGIKRDLYEGGIRVPLIAWWPGTIAAGTTNSRPVALWDLLPTFAEVAGTTAPKGLDGASFAPLLFGRKLEREPKPFYWEFHERGYQKAARIGDWKAVQLATNQPIELYDLKSDPGEARNVAAENPTVVRELTEYLTTAADPWTPPAEPKVQVAGRPGSPLPPNPADRVEGLIRATNAASYKRR
ncbi:MAG: arylsulfatase [Verrucomicrobia bacterium]|nr:arylsulfatase [Verrucomicrobiota bacterium]